MKGSRPTALQQTEYEWVYLFGAVNPRTGDSSALLAPTVNTDYMNHHLRFISEQAGPEVHVVLVLDRAGWHLSKALQVPENITLLPLPPYSPSLYANGDVLVCKGSGTLVSELMSQMLVRGYAHSGVLNADLAAAGADN